MWLGKVPQNMLVLLNLANKPRLVVTSIGGTKNTGELSSLTSLAVLREIKIKKVKNSKISSNCQVKVNDILARSNRLEDLFKDFANCGNCTFSLQY